jgi:hypothetical protein
MKKKIGIFVYSRTNYFYLYKLGCILKKNYEIVLILGSSNLEKIHLNKKIKTINVFFSDDIYDNQKIYNLPKFSIINKIRIFKKLVTGILKFFNLYNTKNFIYFFLKIYIKYVYSFIKFKFVKIDYLIVPGDRETVQELSFIKFSRDRDIPVLLCPVSSLQGNEYDLIKDSFREKHLINSKKFVQKFPRQIKKYRNRLISFYGHVHTIVYNFLEILPSNPWQIGGGGSCKVFCESKKYQFNSKCKKNIVSGSLNTDKISDNLLNFRKYNNKKKNFELKYNLNKRKLNLFLNLSNLWEHNYLDYSKHFQLIYLFLDKINIKYIKKKFNLVLFLHPKQEYKNYAHLANKYKITIVNEPSENFLSFFDCFISNDSSSLCIWADYLGIPSLVYNMRNIRKSNKLQRLSNMIYTKSFNVLLNELKNIKRKNYQEKNKNFISEIGKERFINTLKKELT